MSDALQSPIIRHRSAFNFADTVERVTAAILAARMTIFARIDHAAAARQAGFRMPSTLVILYGDPPRDIPAILAVPQLALELALRVLVAEDAEAHCSIAFQPVVPLLYHAGISMGNAIQFEQKQDLLAAAVGSPGPHIPQRAWHCPSADT